MKKLLLFLTLITTMAPFVSASSEVGAQLYQQCAGCHGNNGANKAFDKSKIIASLSFVELIQRITFYKKTEFGTLDSTAVMAKQIKALDEEQIKELALYISTLKY